jgi:N-acetylmuramoyl-L-alanine amidase
MNIIQDLIPKGRLNRPGRANPCKYITIHETGNYAKGADAKAHASYLKGVNDKVSYHYTVDDKTIYQHLPDNEDAFHAGDGAGAGNRQSIGIEICVNSDGDFNKACENAAELVRYLMQKHNILIHNVVQHNRWNGKDCPKTLRATGKWADFIAMCKEDKPMNNEPSPWAKEAWEKAIKKGITDGTRPKDPTTREEVITLLSRAGVI